MLPISCSGSSKEHARAIGVFIFKASSSRPISLRCLMRITSLSLKNFRCHAETALELDRFNFIRGPNGCGKSSIEMALEFLFTSKCELTDAAGRGAEALIRTGAKEFEISARLASGQTIVRRRGPKSHVVELDGNRIMVIQD